MLQVILVVLQVILVDERVSDSHDVASLNTAWVCACVRGMVPHDAAVDGLRYMRYRAEPQAPVKPPTRILAVVGLAHVAGICAEWDKEDSQPVL